MTDRGGVAGARVPIPSGDGASPLDKAAKLPLEGKTRTWNTRALPLRVGADAVAAASAGVLVAPIISIIDRGIIENASGKRTLGESIRASLKNLLFRPHTFFFSRPFALIFTVYSGTYLSANLTDTISSTLTNTRASSTTHGTSKFLATSATNLSLSLWKDANFTRLFSPIAPRPVPAPTYMLFALRDSLTIAASFNIPPLLAPHIPAQFLPSIRRESIAQFAAPAAVQVISTPLHLLGLDFYNRNGSTTLGQRWEMVRGAWAVSVVARLGRIVPAFGVGGVVNAGVRRGLMERVEG